MQSNKGGNLQISFSDNVPTLRPWGRSEAPSLLCAAPIDCRYLSGASHKTGYERVESLEDGHFLASVGWIDEAWRFDVEDRWEEGPNRVRLERRVRVAGTRTEGPTGAAFQLRLAFHVATQPEDWQFFVPGLVYPGSQRTEVRLATFSDERLAYPMVAGYQRSSGLCVCVSRITTARYDNPPVRGPGERTFRQATDIGSCGFSREDNGISFHLAWPFAEEEQSTMLDAMGSSASAFFPLDRPLSEALFCYEIEIHQATNYAEAVFHSFKGGFGRSRPKPPSIPFSLHKAVAFRLASLARTYYESGNGEAGFLLNFNPEAGYDSPARAFGASFTAHDTRDSHQILEYGFTGRQLNAAYMLAKTYGGLWWDRSKRVVNFFVEALATPSGWFYTLYHLGRSLPLYTIGDPTGVVMHYLATSARPANYTRMMVEAASDLLLNYQLHRKHGIVHEHWLSSCARFADFLVARQNGDGSWYRAYTPSGAAIRDGQWFGANGPGAKSATSVPIPFLLALAEEATSSRSIYLTAARKAGDFVAREFVARDEYRGGTLDNPNVVDKEAVMLAMAALLSLHSKFGDNEYLKGAERAAKLAVTWTSLWNVPPIVDTRLDRAQVRSTGWGGINSIWGMAVTDIYSLFFLQALVRLGKITHEPLFGEIAALVAHGTQQILSHPGELFGFADIGMQPEGIAFSNQGIDDGLIAKGDIWGGLGWIYTAGTFGLSAYLEELEEKEEN